MTQLRASRSGFTLVEMVLAIGIAVGILMVALYFYQQSARLRSHMLEESERLAAARLLLDRLTTDLRCAMAQPMESFQGGSSSLRFVKAGLSGRSARAGASDLQIVSYTTTTAREGTNTVVTGVSRTEEPMGAKAKPATTNLFTPNLTPSVNLAGAALSPPIADASNVVNQAAAPMTELVRYLHFSYWDGTGWIGNWSSRQLPLGVMVTIAFDSVPEGLEAEDMDVEIYRRVIDLSVQGSNHNTRPAAHAWVPGRATSGGERGHASSGDGSRHAGGAGS